MKKMRILVFCVFLVLLVGLYPKPVHAEEMQHEELGITSPSAILMEPETGAILYEKDAHEALRPASVTKIMTILLTMEAVRDGKASLEDLVTVSANAAGYGGSTILLEEGEQISLENLVKGMCIASGNDAAIAAAEYIGGSQEGFVQLMNQRANELGMEDTHFVNPCGLDAEGHVTSAYDIAVMSKELINEFPQILEYTGIWHEMMPHNWKKGPGETDMANTNKLIRSYEGMKGLKTGFTRLAKYSLSAVAERNGLTLIAVIMGAETKEIRSQEICKLMDHGFGSYEMQELPTDGTLTGEVKISAGSPANAAARIQGNLKILTGKGEVPDLSQMETQIQWRENLKAPIQQGDILGWIRYYRQDQQIGELPLYSDTDIQKATWKDRIVSLLNIWS